MVVAAGAIAAHHLAFYWLQSRGMPVQAFTVGSGFGIVLLQAGYVIVETAFVCVMAIQLRRQVDALDHEAESLVELADTLATGATLPPAIVQQSFRSGSLAQALVRMSVQVEERIAQQQQLLLEKIGASAWRWMHRRWPWRLLMGRALPSIAISRSSY
ncbi:hypothetical protein VC290_17820 [Xanthomonas campestris]|uniref:hypothetical protein n=1 Tax=Xanthomonas campestris TaxID=339 RepID=UPI002B232BA9|nr:hypothetical protein [Xanthomonas campestris]MEA9482185.1 hypothetical protein [Xanthomonas campestris]